MIGEITNHLWQSTIFAFAVALVAFAFRKNRAEVRYWMWLSASLKFLIPFSLLIGVGLRVWHLLLAGNRPGADRNAHCVDCDGRNHPAIS